MKATLSKTAPNGKGVGRNKLVIDYSEVERLAALNMTDKNIALCLGIHERSLSKRKLDDDRFIQAMQKGKARGLAAVTGALAHNAIEKNNVVAQIFFLKNADPDTWKDKQDINHSGGVTVNVAGFVNEDAKSLHNNAIDSECEHIESEQSKLSD